MNICGAKIGGYEDGICGGDGYRGSDYGDANNDRDAGVAKKMMTLRDGGFHAEEASTEAATEVGDTWKTHNYGVIYYQRQEIINMNIVKIYTTTNGSTQKEKDLSITGYKKFNASYQTKTNIWLVATKQKLAVTISVMKR
ncbi:hypothetical protein ElyMa_005385400 [Elysia marginata]|uniref:Uncharacterized protein n=1 Tax=Elysia marginata TaxID=1093978 RepID=A0AAV4EGF0_9GAST|nr:hypothetical protein ElyMa_005385400 [Elysia marginata]